MQSKIPSSCWSMEIASFVVFENFLSFFVTNPTINCVSLFCHLPKHIYDQVCYYLTNTSGVLYGVWTCYPSKVCWFCMWCLIFSFQWYVLYTVACLFDMCLFFSIALSEYFQFMSWNVPLVACAYLFLLSMLKSRVWLKYLKKRQ